MQFLKRRRKWKHEHTMCNNAAPPDSLMGANFIFLSTLLKSVSLVVPANSLSSKSAIVSINSLQIIEI